MKYSLYTDGGSRGNPGPAAAGFVIKDGEGKTVVAEGIYLGTLTNNQAEYKALLLGLAKMAELAPGANLACYLDSELIVKQLKQEYRVKDEKLKPLFAAVRDYVFQFPGMSFTHIRREKNKEADAMVNQALDQIVGKSAGRTH